YGVAPWLTWNDHPFASHLELMNVPASTPSRLLLEYQLRSANLPTGQFVDHYSDRSTTSGPLGPYSGPPYGHLLNFFHSSNVADDAAGAWNVQGPAATPYAHSNFFRVLEFVRVPSRFDGAEVILNPQLFT